MSQYDSISSKIIYYTSSICNVQLMESFQFENYNSTIFKLIHMKFGNKIDLKNHSPISRIKNYFKAYLLTL